MAEDYENRKLARLDDYRPISVLDLKAGFIYDATMTNYTDNGMCFQTNGVLHSGSEIYIGLENSPFITYTDIRECYRAEIIWQKKLTMSFPEYVYGIKYYPIGNRNNLKKGENQKNIDNRKKPRKLYSKPIPFYAHKEIMKGQSKNVSLCGIFIETKDALSVGQKFTLAIPHKSINHMIIGGEVVWSNHEGFGAKFMRIKKK